MIVDNLHSDMLKLIQVVTTLVCSALLISCVDQKLKYNEVADRKLDTNAVKRVALTETSYVNLYLGLHIEFPTNMRSIKGTHSTSSQIDESEALVGDELFVVVNWDEGLMVRGRLPRSSVMRASEFLDSYRGLADSAYRLKYEEMGYQVFTYYYAEQFGIPGVSVHDVRLKVAQNDDGLRIRTYLLRYNSYVLMVEFLSPERSFAQHVDSIDKSIAVSFGGRPPLVESVMQIVRAYGSGLSHR